MSYVTPAEVRAQLTPGGGDVPAPEENGTAATMSDADLQEQIDTAQAYVNGRLAVRYSVPFTTPYPKLIMDVTAAMAGWHATLSYRESTDLEFNDPVSLRYRWAQQVLNELRDGLIELFPDDAASGVSEVYNQYDSELFGASEFNIRGTIPRGQFGNPVVW